MKSLINEILPNPEIYLKEDIFSKTFVKAISKLNCFSKMESPRFDTSNRWSKKSHVRGRGSYKKFD